MDDDNHKDKYVYSLLNTQEMPLIIIIWGCMQNGDNFTKGYSVDWK